MNKAENFEPYLDIQWPKS